MTQAAVVQDPEQEFDLKGFIVEQKSEKNIETEEERDSVNLVPSTGGDIMVFARTPDEMAKAQDALLGWANRKISAIEAELVIKEQNLQAAKDAKIRTAGWAREVRLARKDIAYYTKIRDALHEGYFIVPDFPVHVIGVRTTKIYPTDQKDYRHRGVIDNEEHEELPVGDGEYKDPVPGPYSFQEDTGKKDEKGRTITETKWTASGTELKSIDFPMRLIRPHLLKDLKKAMGHKIFDAIGILPGPRQRSRDPMLVGIVENRVSKYRIKRQMFLISWWIPTQSL